MEFETLKNYTKLLLELQSIRMNIATMYKPIKSPQISGDGSQHVALPSSPTERALNTIEKLRRLEERKLAEIDRQLTEVNAWMEQIDDPEIRAIVRYHYLQGMSWNATSRAMYGIDAGDAVRKKFNRYRRAHSKS